MSVNSALSGVMLSSSLPHSAPWGLDPTHILPASASIYMLARSFSSFRLHSTSPPLAGPAFPQWGYFVTWL